MNLLKDICKKQGIECTDFLTSFTGNKRFLLKQELTGLQTDDLFCCPDMH